MEMTEFSKESSTYFLEASSVPYVIAVETSYFTFMPGLRVK